MSTRPVPFLPFVFSQERVPITIHGKIAFYERRAGEELAAYRRARATHGLGWVHAAKRHWANHVRYRDEVARLRAFLRRTLPAVAHPVTRRVAAPPPVFTVAVQRAPRPAGLFQAGVFGPAMDASAASTEMRQVPNQMQPATTEEGMQASAKVSADVEASISGPPWYKTTLGVLFLLGTAGAIAYGMSPKKGGGRAPASASASVTRSSSSAAAA